MNLKKLLATLVPVVPKALPTVIVAVPVAQQVFREVRQIVRDEKKAATKR